MTEKQYPFIMQCFLSLMLYNSNCPENFLSERIIIAMLTNIVVTTGNFSNSDLKTWTPALLQDRTSFKKYSYRWRLGTTENVAESSMWFIYPLVSQYRKSFSNFVLVFQKILMTFPNTRSSRCKHKEQRRTHLRNTGLHQGPVKESDNRLSRKTCYGVDRMRTLQVQCVVVVFCMCCPLTTTPSLLTCLQLPGNGVWLLSSASGTWGFHVSI